MQSRNNILTAQLHRVSYCSIIATKVLHARCDQGFIDLMHIKRPGYDTIQAKVKQCKLAHTKEI